jgi:hypothetical protein
MPPFVQTTEPLLALVTHLGQMAQPVGQMTTRQHLSALAQRGDRLAAERLRAPNVPDALAYLVDWWHELGAGRGAGGFGPAPLTWHDIAAWSAVTGTALAPIEATVLLRMDRVFLSAAMPPQRSR